jgi:hypothetical protein
MIVKVLIFWDIKDSTALYPRKYNPSSCHLFFDHEQEEEEEEELYLIRVLACP